MVEENGVLEVQSNGDTDNSELIQELMKEKDLLDKRNPGVMYAQKLISQGEKLHLPEL